MIRMSVRDVASLTGRSMTREEAYAARADAKMAKPKYGNHKVETPTGEKFDSKAEYRRWCQLDLLAKAGEIKDLRRQVPYLLVPAQVTPEKKTIRPVNYIADMVYQDKAGKVVVEDVKGVETAEYRIKKKLMLMVHGIWVREIRT